MPGEVTLTDLNNAVTTTLGQSSNNSNAVSTTGQEADDSFNPTQMQDVINKLDELINELRRRAREDLVTNSCCYC